MSFRFVDAIFWIAVGCCAIAQSAILYSVLRVSPSRRSSANTASASQPISSPSRAIEIAWAVMPGVALIFVLLYTWRAMR
jgi:heme/copper-type cytochrome/quinol oxidase subunit 2